MTIVLQALNGLTIGAIYILLASGLTIVFGLQGIVNVAHGVFYMFGAYLAINLYPRIGFALTIVAAFLALFLIAIVLLTMFNSFYHAGLILVAVVLATPGLREVADLLWLKLRVLLGMDL